MGTSFSSFLPWIKRYNARKARNKERVALNANEPTPADCRQQRRSNLVTHNESLASILKECQEISRDILKAPEKEKIIGSMVPLEDISKACEKDEDDQVSVATVDDPPVPPPPVGPPLPPPPPPPGGSQEARILPHGLAQKEKIKVSRKLLNPRWKNVDVNSLPKDAIWVKQGDQAMSALKDYLVNNLTSKFPQLGRSISFQEPKRSKMDNQLCLKLTILKNTVKTSDSNEIVNHILQCDKKFLTSEILKQLRNLLPKEGANNFLDEPSKSFLSPILSIYRLPERIDVLLFRLEHEESVNEHQCQLLKNIKIVQKACRELKESESMMKILNLILYIGNIMKSSSDEQLSYGFDISYLVKLNNMKQENKQFSLLDFLVETISEKFPACLDFQTEIPSIPDASCVSFTEITEWVDQQRSGLQKVQTEIKEANFPSNGDKLKEVLTPFAEMVFTNTAKLEDAMLQMKKEFHEINRYFAYAHENKEIDQCMEFFGYFKTFQEQFLFSVNKIRGKTNNEKKRNVREKRNKKI